MKSFIRRTLALGALSVSLLMAGTGSRQALALTQEQVADKLADVPVYVLGSDQGLILISGGENSQVAEPSLFVFMNEQSAETFLARANERNPNFAPNAQIELANLEKLYEESQGNGGQSLNLVYFPDQEEVQQATALGEGYNGGVPLFFATRADGSILPMQQRNGETILPLFFSQADLNELLDQLATENPEARDAVSVSVRPLEAVLLELQGSNNEAFNQIRLLPDSEVINQIREQQPSPGQ